MDVVLDVRPRLATDRFPLLLLALLFAPAAIHVLASRAAIILAMMAMMAAMVVMTMMAMSLNRVF